MYKRTTKFKPNLSRGKQHYLKHNAFFSFSDVDYYAIKSYLKGLVSLQDLSSEIAAAIVFSDVPAYNCFLSFEGNSFCFLFRELQLAIFKSFSLSSNFFPL